MSIANPVASETTPVATLQNASPPMITHDRRCAVAETPEQESGDGVDPEESRIDERELFRRQTELLAQLRHHCHQDRAVGRVEECHQPQQADQHPWIVARLRCAIDPCVSFYGTHGSPNLRTLQPSVFGNGHNVPVLAIPCAGSSFTYFAATRRTGA